jgi:hypothetical protein
MANVDVDVHFRASPNQALDFMKNLAREDAFREAVADNPVGMLALYGIFVTPPGAEELKSPLARWKPWEPRSHPDWLAALENEELVARVRDLEALGFTNKGFLPPKHVVEQALVNVWHANEFGPQPQGEFTGIDSFGFWLFLPLTST